MIPSHIQCFMMCLNGSTIMLLPYAYDTAAESTVLNCAQPVATIVHSAECKHMFTTVCWPVVILF
jgi:hypothetical protein